MNTYWRITILAACTLSSIAGCLPGNAAVETVNPTNGVLYAYAERATLDAVLPWFPDWRLFQERPITRRLDPGKAETIYARDWPREESAYPGEKGVLTFVDEYGRIVYQRFYTWRELAAVDWLVSLDLAAAIEQQDEP